MRIAKEQLVQNIKDIGQSLIDNAETIAGSYRYTSEILITCHPESYDTCPYINVSTDFVPERFIEEYRSENDKSR